VIGTFCKKYRPTGAREYSIMVFTDDGRYFYAPESEWVLMDEFTIKISF